MADSVHLPGLQLSPFLVQGDQGHNLAIFPITDASFTDVSKRRGEEEILVL